MRYPSRLVVLVVCLLACLVGLTLSAPVRAQANVPPSVSPSVVYVSSGNLILAVANPGGTVTTLVSDSGFAYEGMVVGPDNADSNRPGYLLYACDPSHNRIIRFDPNNPPFAQGANSAEEIVYSGNGALQQPQCGRFDNSGDLIVTSEVAGSGFWIIPNVANVAFTPGGKGSNFSTPSQNAPDAAVSATQVAEGIAQGTTGSLFIVDAANTQIIRAPYTSTVLGAPFSSLQDGCLIGPTGSNCTNTTSTIPAPFGVAKRSTGNIYVSNQSKKVNNIVYFGPTGTGGSTCVDFSKTNPKVSPLFFQAAADDTLYVATTSNSSNGALFSIPTGAGGACGTPVVINSTLPALTGVALPPSTVSQTVSNFSGNQTFNFGFAAFQFSSTSCTLTVAATEQNSAVVQSLIQDVTTDPSNPPTNMFFGGSPSPDLGRDGFETVFQFDVPPDCAPDSAGLNDPLTPPNAEALATQVDNLLVPNPRVLHCDGNVCGVVETFGDYPLGGILPQDTTISGRDGGSLHFLINETSGGSEPGTFCGFQSPLSNTPPPGIAGVFSSGQNLSLKFKLAAGTGAAANCQNGPFVTDATALISVAQIFDAHGNAVFIPNTAIDASGNSTPIQPLFKNDPTNKQYQFSLSLQGYAKGIYSLTITFLSSNTSFQVAEIKVQ